MDDYAGGGRYVNRKDTPLIEECIVPTKIQELCDTNSEAATRFSITSGNWQGARKFEVQAWE